MDSSGFVHPRAKTGRRSGNARDAWTRPLWPLHLKPYPDELLSSWLIRLAHAHGLKVQTFCRLLIGSQYQIWNRDIDRIAPKWLIDMLVRHTGTPPDTVLDTTLRGYEGKLYRTYREGYVLQWILPLDIKRFKWTGFGLQFCSKCLAEDPEPYFRRHWRVGFGSWCTEHEVMLRDRCPICGHPVVPHRQELGKPNEIDDGSMALCHACGFDLRTAPVESVPFYDNSARVAHELAIRRLDGSGPWCKPRSVRYYNVLHQLCRLLQVRYRNVKLHEFACQQLGLPIPLIESGHRVLEARPVGERHHLVQLALWYMADLSKRLTKAWANGAITYSALVRDFDDRPDWYNRLVVKLTDRKINTQNS